MQIDLYTSKGRIMNFKIAKRQDKLVDTNWWMCYVISVSVHC